MGSVTLPTMAIIAAVGTATAAGVAAYSSHEQGVAVKNADKQKARVEQDQETQKQISMRQNMLRSLASQNAASLGAVGTGRGTSFGANTNRQITEAQNDIMVSQANSSAQISLLDQAGNNAETAGNLGAVSSLASGAAKLAGS